METALHQKLDAILKKLDSIGPLQKEVESLKIELLQQSKAQENEVRRLAGNFEHLLNSQREMEYKLNDLEKGGRVIQELLVSMIESKVSTDDDDVSTEDEDVEHAKALKVKKMKQTDQEEVSREVKLTVEKSERTRGIQQSKEEPSTDRKDEATTNGSSHKTAETSNSDENDTKKISSEILHKEMEKKETSKSDADTNNVANTPNEAKKRYKCHSCKLFLRKKVDDPCVKCSDIYCQKWNIAMKLNSGNQWVALANPCGHIQQVPTSRKIGESWTCTQCNKLGKIDYVFKIKESEEVIVEDEHVFDELDRRGYVCGRCMGPLQPNTDPSDYVVTCPRCQNISYAYLQETMLSNLSKNQYLRNMYKCLMCSVTLPKTREEDGVSVRCEICRTLICAAPRKPGYRWIRLLLSKENPHLLVCDHAQLLPIDHPELAQWRCKICGAPGYITELANNALVVKIPVDDSNLTYKCNQCKTDLPKPENDDDVKVSCPQCKGLNIVGRLQEGYKWVFLKPCKHFQQSEQYNKSGEQTKCKICGKEGTINDVQPRWIPVTIDATEALDQTGVKEARLCDCGALLPKTLREDKISIECTKCGKVVLIVGLKKGHRWAIHQSCGHCMQIPSSITADYYGKCDTCQQSGPIITEFLNLNNEIE